LAGPLSRALRNAGVLLGGRAAGGVLGFATTLLAARALGLEAFGFLLLIHAFAGSVCAVTRLQSWQPLLQFGSAPFEAGDREKFQSLLRHCMLLDGAGALAGVVIGLPIAWAAGPALGWSGHGTAALLYVTSILFMNTGAALGLMRLANRFGTAAMADTAGAAVRLAGTLAGMLLHWGLPEFLAIWYLATVTAFSIDVIAMRRIIRRIAVTTNFRLKAAPWWSPTQGIWKFTFATSANQTLIDLSSKIGILLVGGAIGPANAALFRVTAQIGQALSEPAQLLTLSLYPEFVKLRDGRDLQGMRRVALRVFGGLAVFSALALAIAGLLGPWLLASLLGVHHPGILLLLLLMTAAAVLDIWDVPLEPLLAALGRARQLFRGRLAGMLLSLPLLYFLARIWGVDGAAWGVLAGEVVIFLTRLIPFLRMGSARR
jgi:O-antigen/teichoic acid export membrane protein